MRERERDGERERERWREREREKEMVAFGKPDKMIKNKWKKWINRKLTTGLAVVFRSLFKEELFQTKTILSFSIVFDCDYLALTIYLYSHSQSQ